MAKHHPHRSLAAEALASTTFTSKSFSLNILDFYFAAKNFLKLVSTFSGMLSFWYPKISWEINLFKSDKSPWAVFHSYFFYKNMQTPSITISTIFGGLGKVLICIKPLNKYKSINDLPFCRYFQQLIRIFPILA